LSALLQLPIEPDGVEKSDVVFGEWLPDQPTLSNPGAIEALNVMPADGSYVPFPQFEFRNNRVALGDTVNGAVAVIGADNVVQTYAATSNNGVYTDATGAWINTLAITTSDNFSWQFIRVNDQMVAIHPEEWPTRSTVDTADMFQYLTGASNTAPKAACGAQVVDFLMLGDLYVDPDDGGGRFPSRIRWGGFNNIDAPWISDPATQADFNDMPPEGGSITAIVGRDIATIFQARMISQARYVGLPDVFEISHVETKRGAISRDAVIDLGVFKFFIAEDGFYVWNGTNATPIGDGKVNKYFFGKLDWSMRNRISGAVDFINGCVMWAFPTDASGTLSEIIIYSYRDNKWAHSIQTLDVLFNSAKSNISLEDLTDPLESYTYSFDDPILRQGGRSELAAFNSTHSLGSFTGLPMAAIIDTGEFSGPNSRRVFTNGVRPIVDLATPEATIEVAMRDQMIGQPVIFEGPVAQEIDGICPILADARYMRFRLNLPIGASWKHAVGVEVARKAGGEF
jgi:hypothetical protein